MSIKTACVLVVLLGSAALADTAIVKGSDGKYYAVQTVAPAVNVPPGTPILETASLPNPWPNGHIYYTVPAGPLGSLNLVTPWSAGILAEGWDFIGHESITQGYLPLFQLWKVTGVFGGGVNPSGEGSPLAGGVINIATVNMGQNTDFHIAATGGYNINEHHAMAVLSGSVQFLK